MNTPQYFSQYKPKAHDSILILGGFMGWTLDDLIGFEDFRTMRVFIVEPSPWACIRIAEKICNNGFDNVTLLSCAVASEVGIRKLYMRKSGVLNSLYEDKVNRESPDEHNEVIFEASVPTLTIDKIIDIVGRVDLLICDIEGAEIEVFTKRAKKLIKVKNMAIACEHWAPIESDYSGRTLTYLTEELPKLGFSVSIPCEGVDAGEPIVLARRKKQ